MTPILDEKSKWDKRVNVQTDWTGDRDGSGATWSPEGNQKRRKS